MKGISGNPALDAYHRMSSVTATRPVARPEAAASTPQANEAAKVSISSAARELLASGDSKVSAERVQELKQMVAEGKFQVNAALVAERIVEGMGQ